MPDTSQAPDAALQPLLNPRPHISVVPLFDGHECVVIDDFMLEPEALVEFAAHNRAQFQDAPGNYYPGPEMPLGGALAARLQDSFLQHARTVLGARRVLNMRSRLSLVTRRPDQLLAGQRLPHRDFTGLPDGEGAAAMVLYLFKDARFGGTSFFRPAVAMDKIDALMRDLKRREQAGEPAPDGVPPTFAIGSSRWFERMETIAPRYNRAIFYNGGIFHSGHIDMPELMVDDPRTGRLTVNAFFRLRMAAA